MKNKKYNTLSMSQKRLAVIMSIYINDKIDYVNQSVNSILNQTFKDFDFFIQYDGPVAQDIDDFLSLVNDDRLIIKKRDVNEGLAKSLNELLNIVLPRGYEYIARMDADDVSFLDRFQKQIDYLDKNPEIDLLGGAMIEIDENGKARNKTIHYPLSHEECRRFFAKRNPIAHPTVIFRKSFFSKTGCLYPEEFVRNDDTVLWMEGFKHGAIMANMPDVILNYRITNDFFTQRRSGRDFAKSQLELRKIINKELGYGWMSYIYAYAMYVVMISPPCLIKLAYKVLR